MWPAPPAKPLGAERQRRNACSDHATTFAPFVSRGAPWRWGVLTLSSGRACVLLTQQAPALRPLLATSAATDSLDVFIPLPGLILMGNPPPVPSSFPPAVSVSERPSPLDGARAGAVILPLALRERRQGFHGRSDSHPSAGLQPRP